MNAIAIKHNDEIIDLQTAEELGFEGEQIHLDNSADSLEVLRHSTAHLWPRLSSHSTQMQSSMLDQL